MVHGDRLAHRVRAEGALALALGSALAGATAARIVFPDAPLSAFVLAAMLGVLGLAAATRPSKEDDPGLEWLAVFGMLVSVPASVALARPSAICLALFLAPPAGLALAAFWWSLLAALRELLASRTLEDHEVARQLSGRWLALLGGVSAPTAILGADVFLGTAAIATAAIGCVRTVTASRARRRRWRWLELVRRGGDPRWRVVPASEFPRAMIDGLAPLVRSRAAFDGVLVEGAGAGPYREGGPGWPRALVPLSPDTPDWYCRVNALRGAAAVVGALLAPLLSLILSAAAAEVLARDNVSCTTPADLLCGWLLLLSGPTTGVALLFLSHLYGPTRGTVWWLGISVYLLVSPFVCLLLSFSAHPCCP